MPKPTTLTITRPAAPRLALLLALAACNPVPAAPSAAAAATIDLDDPAGTLARLAREPEGPGRKPFLQALRNTPAAHVVPILETGLASTDPALRAAAALAAGRRRDGTHFAATLLNLATTDPDASVRIAATRSLAVLRHAEAFPALVDNLSHETATVRLSALRALARIDKAKAATLPDLARLQLDPDPRVSDAATKVARGLPPR